MILVRFILECFWALVAEEECLVEVVLHETIDLVTVRVLVNGTTCRASVLDSGPLLDAACTCQTVAALTLTGVCDDESANRANEVVV